MNQGDAIRIFKEKSPGKFQRLEDMIGSEKALRFIQKHGLNPLVVTKGLAIEEVKYFVRRIFWS